MIVGGLLFWTLVGNLLGAEPGLPSADPSAVGMRADRLRAIDAIVAEGIRDGAMPGCVVTVGRAGKIIWNKAYGNRQVQPRVLPMTVDTVFDLASITKPVATGTSILLLIERGQIRVDDPVVKFVPEFAVDDKENVTIRQLLTHQSGLIADNPESDYADGPEKAMARVFAQKLKTKPGEKFVYSDVGFIMLGEIVRRVSGKDVATFAKENIFMPLGMADTGYLPTGPLRARSAPTEKRNDVFIQGEVHDPRASRLGGVAGHAGLFSTSADLARYAEMLLRSGVGPKGRVLKPETVQLFRSPQPVSSGLRTLGWDMKTGYSSNRGDLLSPAAFGHGGFTGTSFWIDPDNDLFVIFLSSRLHPEGKRTLVNPLAGRIGTVVASSIVGPAPRLASETPVVPGCEVLARDHYVLLKGRKVGLVTNPTGVDRQGRSTAELLASAPGVELVALFSPEHGLEANLDVANIADSKDKRTGRKVFSLYGKTRKPTSEMLAGIDTLVFDIQDIGVRFYTYISTLGNVLEAAAENQLRVVVLDRPNPIDGVTLEGPLRDPGKPSFIAYHDLPIRHGLTVGELARMLAKEKSLSVDLQVVRVEGWKRSQWFDETGLPWVNPSPNMRNLNQAILYPGIGLLETTNVSVGRGTDTPFEIVGAPWIDGVVLAERLRAANLPGVRFVPTRFTPTSSKFEKQRCGGVQILITQRDKLRPVLTGLSLATALRDLYPKQWEIENYARLLLSQKTMDALRSGRSAAEIDALFTDELGAFEKRRAPFLLY